jgi:acyl carrier protein
VSRSVVKEIFIDVLGLELPVDWESVRYQAVDGWDSLGHMALIGEIEDRFGILLETEQIVDISSFSRALEVLRIYGVSEL